jgi:hypothetical protein
MGVAGALGEHAPAAFVNTSGDLATRFKYHACNLLGVQVLEAGMVDRLLGWLVVEHDRTANEAKELRLVDMVLMMKAAVLKRHEAADGPPPLTEEQQQVFDYIKAHGPKTGKEIVSHLGLSSESAFTSHIVPALKPHGVKNRRGRGYYLPS